MVRKKFHLAFAVLFASISVALAAPSYAETTLACPAPSKAPRDMGILTVASLSALMPNIEWGIEQGCFKKFGLTIKTVQVASNQVGITGLIGNSYDLTTATPTNLVLAMANGGFAGMIIAPRHGYSAQELARAKVEPLYPSSLLLQTVLLVKKDSPIKTWKDFEARKIAVRAIKSEQQSGILLAMRASGASTSKTQFLAMTDSQMAVALDRGDVDAVVPSDPYATQIILSGARVIGYPTAYYTEPGAAVVYASSKEIANQKRAAMKAFQNAVLQINGLLNKPENEASYRKKIAEVTGVKPEAAAKDRLPTMVEKNVTFTEIAYIPNKLKSLGFITARVNLAPVIFH